MCGSKQLQSRIDVDHFQYGSGNDQVKLTAAVRVYVCASCRYSFTTSEAEDARHGAVCRHLGLLTPAEVREIRDSIGLSRAQFAAITKIGEATLARWERGEILQNAAYDQYLRLIAQRDIFSRLQSNNAKTASSPANDQPKVPRFRQFQPSEQDVKAKSEFRLQRI